MRFFVVVPFYNEAAGIRPTLEALAAQSDRDFSLVLVDNGSTDSSAQLCREFAASADFPVDVIAEPTKGTGAASDTGFRYAIAQGATHVARTDADCLPDVHWVRHLKRAFKEEGLEFVAGKIVPRTDEWPLSPFERRWIVLLVNVAERFGRLHRRGRQFKYPYILAVGNNMAITADLYLRAGGFPRTSIDRVHEDRELSERVRTLTRHGGVRSNIVVANSVRRAKRYGYVRTVLWYLAHWARPAEVDVR
jgi:glycosyltransferase involved in cell wall biosynthesis